MILRDLITRLTFKVDTNALRGLDSRVGSIRKSFGKLAAAIAGGAAIRRGGTLEELDQRLKNLSGGQGNLTKFNEAIGKLPGIFPKREATLGLISVLEEFGKFGKTFSAGDVLKVMEQATLLTGRTGESLDVLMAKLAGFMASGEGFPGFLLRVGLITKEAADSMRLVISEIAGGSGKMTRPMMTQIGKMLTGVIDDNSGILQKELEERSALSVLRLEAKWSDLWNRISKLSVAALGPALDIATDMMDVVEKQLKAWGGIEKVLERINPFKAGQRARAYLEGTGPESIRRQKQRELQGQIKPSLAPPLEALMDFLRSFGGVGIEGYGGTPPSEPTESEKQLKKKRGLGLNIHGDVNISVPIPAGMNAEMVANLVYEKFQDEMRQVGNSYVGSLEVPG